MSAIYAHQSIVSKLKDGELSAPTRAGDAFIIVKREGYRPKKEANYAESANKAASLSHTEKIQKRIAAFYNQLKTDTLIKIMLPTVPAKWLND